MPVDQDASGQSESTEQASKPRLIESPTEAIELGRGSHVGVGFAAGRLAPDRALLAPAPPESLVHPASSAAHASRAVAAVERRRRVD
ncbi:hypothetical protein GCM10023324_51780 [Streptomyces youssoufiensis]